MLRSGELTTTEKQYVCLYLKLKLHRNIVDNIFFYHIILYSEGRKYRGNNC
jgi:hypothetical protein